MIAMLQVWRLVLAVRLRVRAQVLLAVSSSLSKVAMAQARPRT